MHLRVAQPLWAQGTRAGQKVHTCHYRANGQLPLEPRTNLSLAISGDTSNIAELRAGITFVDS